MTTILTMLSVSHVVQGIIVGGVLAFLTAQIIMNAVVKAMTTTVNGWSTTFKCGQPGNGILLRAACAKVLPAVNVVQEAAYWTTTVDSAGRRLSGQREYVLHFPAGQLPPNDAFWSLTMTDVVGYMVSNPSIAPASALAPASCRTPMAPSTFICSARLPLGTSPTGCLHRHASSS